MRKMHLPARVPNEGAGQLARWIARRTEGRIDLAATALRIDEVILQRLILGEIIPGDILGRSLWERAGINKYLFQHGARTTWFKMPARRPTRRSVKVQEIARGVPPCFTARGGEVGAATAVPTSPIGSAA